jgi:hypothetical protein
LPRKDILSKFGITDQPDLRVQVITEQDNPSMVDVHGPGDPAKTLTPKQATELSILLRDAGEEARARDRRCGGQGSRSQSHRRPLPHGFVPPCIPTRGARP